MLYLNDSTLFANGKKLNPADMTWQDANPAARAGSIPCGTPLDVVAAVQWLQQSDTPFRPPVAVLGPREASQEEKDTARALGKRLANLGLTVLCGGRQGVMEAVCRGVQEGNGISVGLLPEDDWKSGNQFVSIPIATGIGIARNALIARAAACAVAVGGGLGTLSEIALSLQFGKRVFGVCDAPRVPGLRLCTNLDVLEQEICLAVLQLPSGVLPLDDQSR